MISPLVAAAMIFGAVQSSTPQVPAPFQHPEATELSEVVVEGQRNRDAAEAFVRTVSNPVGGRKVATWHQPVCIGIGGLAASPAQVMVDRLSDWADYVGLTVQGPGCTPNIFVVVTDDGDATAQGLVASRRREFLPNIQGSDGGSAALRRFQNSGALVRWWQVSLPMNAETNRPLNRMPGQLPFGGGIVTRPSDLGDFGVSKMASRLSDQSRDDLAQVIVVLDMKAFDAASFTQVTDYVAMSALAQIDRDAVPDVPSILSLFDDAIIPVETLTRWDRAYLHALYDTYQGSHSTGVNMSAIAVAVSREITAQESALNRGAAPE